MSAPTLVLTSTLEAPGHGRSAGPFARAVAAVPPPGLLLVSIVSIQLGAAVAVHLFETLGPIGTVFLRIAFSAVLLLVAARREIGSGARRDVGLLLLFGCVIGAMNMCFYGAISRLPLGLEFEALRRMTARAYGVMVTLEPVVAALVGAIVLGQALPAAALLAIACVTAAAIGVTLSERRSFLT